MISQEISVYPTRANSDFAIISHSGVAAIINKALDVGLDSAHGVLHGCCKP